MASYFIQWKGVVQGPYQDSTVKQLIASNQVSKMHLISSDRLTWIPLSKSVLYAEVSNALIPKKAPEVSSKPKLALKTQDSVPGNQSQQRRPWSRRMVPDSIISSPEPLPLNFAVLDGGEPENESERNDTTERSSYEQPYTVEFNVLDFVRRIFKVHTKEEIDDILLVNKDGVVGVKGRIECPKTWLYSRVFLWLSLLSIVMLFMAGNPMIIPGIILLGTFSMPVVCITFFLETNISRNISVLKVMGLFVFGGVFSLLFTHLISPYFVGLESILQASIAGITEEPAKLLILLFFVGNNRKYPYILNGVLLGATVGAGFAAFESAGYAFVTFLSKAFSDKTEWIDLVLSMLDNIFLRGYLAPFMHIVWTALIGGALWTVRGLGRFEFEMLFKQRVVATFLLSVFLHMLWNSGFMPVKVLGVIAWIGIFHYLKLGLQQVADEQVNLLKKGDE
jgi:RsiW-degrading membrane proteinase PrsW (M82 family)